jgi:hypothetical protein
VNGGGEGCAVDEGLGVEDADTFEFLGRDALVGC